MASKITKNTKVVPIREVKKKTELKIGDVYMWRELFQEFVSKKMDPIVAYDLRFFSSQINELLSAIENTRKSIVEKHGSEKYKNEETGFINIPPATPEFDAFLKDFETFLQKPCDIDFSLLKLEHLSGQQISIDEMREFSRLFLPHLPA